MNIQFIKIFKRSLVFILISAILYILFIGVWGMFLPEKYSKNIKHKLGSSYLRFQEVENYKDIDLLFIGSSHAYRGLDTRIFENAGYTSFNLGTKAQTPIQSAFLLEQYVAQLNPKIIVIEVYPKVFMIDGVESSINIVSNSLAKERVKLIFEHKNIQVLNSYIFSVLNNNFKEFKNIDAIELPSMDTYIKGGYVERKMKLNNMKKHISLEMPFNEKQFTALKEINNFLKKRAILPVYVFAPIVNKDYNSFKEKEAFESRISKLGLYFDFNKIVKLNDTLHFFDSHHLNKDGVAIFNQKLIKVLDTLQNSNNLKME
ncbi:MAG: hypothetical protein ACPG6B_03720 [Oceanihabitans sp.]